MNSPRRMRSERRAGTASGELMGRTPGVKEHGPGGGVGTRVRSESVSALLFFFSKNRKQQKEPKISLERPGGSVFL